MRDGYLEKMLSKDSDKVTLFLESAVLKVVTHICLTQSGTSDYCKGRSSPVRGQKSVTVLNALRMSAFRRKLPWDSGYILESDPTALVGKTQTTSFACTLACKMRICRLPATSISTLALRITGDCAAQLSCASSNPAIPRSTLSMFWQLASSGKYVT